MKTGNKRLVFAVMIGLALSLLLVTRTSEAAQVLVNGDNFNLLFHTGEALAFQHTDYILTMSVISGTLNTTTGDLLMYEPSGRLGFRTLENVTVSLLANQPNLYISLNNAEVNQSVNIPLLSNRAYNFRWAMRTSYTFWDLNVLIGWFGLVGMFPCAYLIISRARDGEYTSALYAVIMAIICFCFFYGWVMHS